ncbi:zinc-dependent alcohol dehydrogenase [Leucobacter sp. BZR 635]
MNTWPEPECGPGDVIVAVAATGICGTDLAYFRGERDIVAGGLVLGHEPWGTILAVGSDVDPGRIGERVAVEPNYPCGSCRPCQAALPSLCTQRRSPVVTEHGFLAERVAVPADFAWQLPDSVSDRDASCIEPLAVAMAAIRRAGDIALRPRIAILGAGSIGRILADVLLRRGVVPAVFDLSAERIAAALDQGARQAMDDERFDLIFETTGSGPAATSVIEQLDAGGALIVVGVGNDAISIDTKTLVRRGLTVTGSMIYDHPSDYGEVIRAVARGDARPGVVLGEPYVLEDAEAALTAAATATTKTWIRMKDGEPRGE